MNFQNFQSNHTFYLCNITHKVRLPEELGVITNARTSVAASGGGITASVYQSVWKDVTILGYKNVSDT